MAHNVNTLARDVLRDLGLLKTREPSPFGALAPRAAPTDLPRATRPLPLPSTVRPNTYEAARLFGRAFPQLPVELQRSIAAGPLTANVENIPTRFEFPASAWGGPLGLASADPESESAVWVALPRRPVPGWVPPWGAPLTPEDVARHELGHVGIERAFHNEGAAMRALAELLRQAGLRDPGFRRRAEVGHQVVRGLFTSPASSLADVVRDQLAAEEARHRKAGLHEFLASFIEQGGQPTRMPPVPLTPAERVELLELWKSLRPYMGALETTLTLADIEGAP